jgi:phage gp46-like protein
MSDLQNFEGDLLLEDSQDGGEIRLVNGIFVNDKTLNTAVYISLMGGNKEDNGRVKNKFTWWGNTLAGTAENEKIVSRFQAVIFGLPMTGKNIQEAENAAALDLRWIASEGVGDEVKVSGSAASRNRFQLKVNILANGKNIYENIFSFLWETGVYGDGV